ncbi:MAG: hypothetical protein JWQ90_3600 [Hydrocarboniphaga sp.]|nr:hypothetical protein [Hydrocarboniphaga sp.]
MTQTVLVVGANARAVADEKIAALGLEHSQTD